MIKVPPQYQDIAKNHHVKLIMMYDADDELELYEDSKQFQIDKKAIQESVDDYKQNGDKNFLSQDEYNQKMDSYKKDLIAKYANH
jgi:DNA-binding transcriptional regulator/RsmH inhibitor MraZ